MRVLSSLLGIAVMLAPCASALALRSTARMASYRREEAATAEEQAIALVQGVGQTEKLRQSAAVSGAQASSAATAEKSAEQTQVTANAAAKLSGTAAARTDTGAKARQSATDQSHDKGKDKPKEILDAIAGGTGVQPGTTGSLTQDHILLKRMNYQDMVVIVVLLAVYGAALALGWIVVYRLLSLRESPVVMFSDRTYSYISDGTRAEGHLKSAVTVQNILATDKSDPSAFVETFLLTPATVRLEVLGISGTEEAGFHFALDLSEHCQVALVDAGESEGMKDAHTRSSYLTSAAANEIKRFLALPNSLARVDIKKKVVWRDWEKLKAQIQRQVRMCGFIGEVVVQLRDTELLTVSKNDTWARFTSHKTTNALCGLSVIGLALWPLYRWLRTKVFVLEARYTIDQDPLDFFAQIQARLGKKGFD